MCANRASCLADEAAPGAAAATPSRWTAAAEVGLIVLLCFIAAGSPPPDVNEAHYLSKARHYWDPGWCPRDLFLESADAHLVFYWTAGWLTLFLPLGTVAWLGRLLTWLLLAWSWRRLSFALVPRPLLAVLTAAWYLALQAWGNMAGEWVVGGFEAKGFAYVLVFLGLESLVRGRWGRMWILFGAAASFHVLVGGWSVVAGGVAWLLAGRHRGSGWAMLPGLLLGGLLSLPGLLPTVALNLGQEPGGTRLANEIYVLHRLPHHLVLGGFPRARRLAFGGMLLVWAVLVWLGGTSGAGDRGPQRRLQAFVAGSLALAGIGGLLSVAAQLPWATGLLRFYWFRLADAVLPLGIALALGSRVAEWVPGGKAEPGEGVNAGSGWQHKPWFRAVVLLAVLLLPAAFLLQRTWLHQRDPRPAAVRQTRGRALAGHRTPRSEYDDWLSVCRWVRTRTPPDSVFITPRQQQTFHWYAQRAEIACWKDVPQDAESLVHWWARIRALYPPEVLEQGLSWHGRSRLIELAQAFGAQYILVDRTRSTAPLDLPRVYPGHGEYNGSFEVYRVPPPIGAAATDAPADGLPGIP